MPTARRIATPTKSASTAIRAPRVVVPVSKAGRSTLSVAQPSTQASATVSAPKSRLPAVESEKISGWRRIATPNTRKPSPSVDPARGSVRVSGAGEATAVVTRLQP